jgi:integrase
VTSPNPAAAAVEWPEATGPVLARRRINPASDPVAASVFADDQWNLTPGLFEAHATTTRLNLRSVPAPFRHPVKHYIWQLINYRPPSQTGQRQPRLALSTMPLVLSRLTSFVLWLGGHRVGSFGAVTDRHLDDYLRDVVASEISSELKAALLIEVRRLWAYRDRLPGSMRLPVSPPWGGDRPRDLLGMRVKRGVNRTPRIRTDIIEVLLLWAMRFTDDFAEDIIAAFHEHLRLWPGSITARPSLRAPRRGLDEVLPELTAYLDRLRATGGALPGRRRADGTLAVDWAHLTRVFSAGDRALARIPQLRRLIEDSGLPVADAAYLDTPITGLVADGPWRPTPIGYSEAPKLATLLRTACFIVIAYLSGMRPGEALNLERGCLSHDPDTDLWLISGRKFKGARDSDGSKIPEGEPRRDPWVVAVPAAHAVVVLERLHGHPLLFPAELHPLRRPRRADSSRIGQARHPSGLTRDITAFIAWVNDHANRLGRPHELIPVDPHGPIAASRFRRTLAWHIVRRPRGLIAGAIQYGHLHLQMTLGYSGSYDSGFPDEHAFEDWLFRLDRLTEDHQSLHDGEHVSGPAADEYRQRVRAGHEQFAGRVLTNIRQARDMLANPTLQIYPGRAMTCVFDPAKALCLHCTGVGGVHVAPDLDDCRTTCQNIAYTDRDIHHLRERAAGLHDLLGDFLAPSPRYQRTRAERDRLRELIRDHEEQHQ